MAFKLKGKSIVQGTSGHAAALKQRNDRRKFELENLKREEAAEKAREKAKTSDNLNDYLKKMDELLDQGISPKEAEQMLAGGSKPLKQVEEKEKGSSSDMDAEAAREDAKMIEIAKKRGYTMKLVDGKLVKVPVDKNTGKPIKDAAPKQNKGKIVYKDGKKYYKASDGTLHTGQVEDYERELESDRANKPLKKNEKVTKDLKYPYSKNKFGDLMYKDNIVNKREAAKIKDSDLYEYNPIKPTSTVNKMKSPAKQKDQEKKYPSSYTKEDIKFLEEQNEDIVRYEDLDEKGKAIWKKQGKPVPNDKANKPETPNKMKSPTKQTDGNNATYERKAGINFQKAKDKIKRLGLNSSDAQFKKIMAEARKKNKALADSLRNN